MHREIAAHQEYLEDRFQAGIPLYDKTRITRTEKLEWERHPGKKLPDETPHQPGHKTWPNPGDNLSGMRIRALDAIRHEGGCLQGVSGHRPPGYAEKKVRDRNHGAR
jgi:hypothetical protein